ncbi:MAG: hypothetical protein AMXMBFR46_01010 [Acidimicrobiia bacterium]
MTAVTTYLCVDGAAAALDFSRSAFGAVELYRLTMPGGGIAHAVRPWSARSPTSSTGTAPALSWIPSVIGGA